jgi:hypothetical protein
LVAGWFFTYCGGVYAETGELFLLLRGERGVHVGVVYQVVGENTVDSFFQMSGVRVVGEELVGNLLGDLKFLGTLVEFHDPALVDTK